MSFLSSFNISASALTAQRVRMDVISENIANSETTRVNGAPQTPYRRKVAVMSSGNLRPSFNDYLSKYTSSSGVRINAIMEDYSPFKTVHDPTHPDADENGDVRLPNVDIMQEMIDMMSATRSYESNITVLDAMKSMAQKALELGR